MNLSRLQALLPYLLACAIAVGLGMLVMQYASRTIAVVPGVRGCEKLGSSSAKTACYSGVLQGRFDEALDGISETQRPAAIAHTLASIDRDAVERPDLAGSCHPALHKVGRREGRRLAARDAAPVFPEKGYRLCTAGYVHGVSEGFMETAATTDIVANFRHLCAQASTAPGCAHGIGHALVRADGTSRSSVLANATRCQRLPSENRPDCANGVFMELGMRSSVSVTEYARTCAAQRGDLRTSCFYYLPQSAATNDQPRDVVPQLCRRHAGGPDSAAYQACARADGRGLGPQQISRCSAYGSGPAGTSCVRGALQLSLDSELITPTQARSTCRELRTLAASCREVVAELTTRSRSGAPAESAPDAA